MKPLQVAGRTHCKDSVAVQVLLVGGDVKEACHGEGAGSLPAAMVHQLVNVFNAIPFPDCHGNALGLLEVHQVWLSGVLALLQPLKEPFNKDNAAPLCLDGTLEASAAHAFLNAAVDSVEEEVLGVTRVP